MLKQIFYWQGIWARACTDVFDAFRKMFQQSWNKSDKPRCSEPPWTQYVNIFRAVSGSSIPWIPWIVFEL